MIRYIILFLPIFVFAKINQNGDVQFWHMEYFQKNVSEFISYKLQTEARIGDDISKPYFFYLQGQYSYDNGFLEIAPGYRQILSRNYGISWGTTYSPLLAVTLKKKFSNYKLSDRNMVQYLIDSEQTRWLYRNMLRIDFPSSLYLSDEVFFLEGNGFMQNRFYLGYKLNISKKMDFSFFYLLRHLDIHGWKHHNILGIYFFCFF